METGMRGSAPAWGRGGVWGSPGLAAGTSCGGFIVCAGCGHILRPTPPPHCCINHVLQFLYYSWFSILGGLDGSGEMACPGLADS